MFRFGGLLGIRHDPRRHGGGVSCFGLPPGHGYHWGLILVTLDGVAAPQPAEEWATASPTNRRRPLRLLHQRGTPARSAATGCLDAGRPAAPGGVIIGPGEQGQVHDSFLPGQRIAHDRLIGDHNVHAESEAFVTRGSRVHCRA